MVGQDVLRPRQHALCLYRASHLLYPRTKIDTDTGLPNTSSNCGILVEGVGIEIDCCRVASLQARQKHFMGMSHLFPVFFTDDNRLVSASVQNVSITIVLRGSLYGAVENK